jgi:hypothetical protein
MFTEPTVIILGAGASLDYDFPLGDALVKNIINGLRTLKLDEIITGAPWAEKRKENDFGLHPYQALISYLWGSSHDNEENAAIQAYKQANFHTNLLKGLEATIDQHRSIDAFLRENPGQQKIGKLYIALEILRHLACKKSFQENNVDYNPKISPSNESGWYGRLIQQIKKGANSGDDLIKDQLTVITFNYDTSLEIYLESNFNKHSELFKGVDYRDYVKILHVYGEVKFRPIVRGENNFRIFGRQVVESAESIRITHEDDHNLKEIQDALYKAKDIYSFGFSFDSLNCERIKLEDALKFKCGNVCFYNHRNHPNVNLQLSKFRIPASNIVSYDKQIRQLIDEGLFATPFLYSPSSLFGTDSEFIDRIQDIKNWKIQPTLHGLDYSDYLLKNGLIKGNAEDYAWIKKERISKSSEPYEQVYEYVINLKLKNTISTQDGLCFARKLT